MTATRAPARSGPVTRRPRPAARLLRLELRHNAMLWMMPVAVALFWFTAERKTLATPPLWSLRAAGMQLSAVVAFASPVAGAAAWMGSRESRRRTTDLVNITARPRPGRLLATWAATTCWALVAYLACLAVVYGVTAQQAAWGGPLWWPAVVAAACLPALTALGFAAGTLVPGRFTAPLVALAAFFVLALSTQLIHGSQSYWQISPVVTGAWDIGPDPGVATFYAYLPDLPIAQVMFLLGLTAAVLGALTLPTGSGLRSLRRSAVAITTAGLVVAGTAVALAGTGRLDAHGMIAIPALHDAASDRPLRYTPVCSHTAIPVCLNPAYASYLPATEAALAPMLDQIAGLPGAPARISQTPATYRQGPGNSVGIGLAGSSISGAPPVLHLLLPVQLPGPALTAGELAGQLRSITGPSIIASVTGDGPGASEAQHAVTTALLMAARVVPSHLPSPQTPTAGNGGPPPGAGAGGERYVGSAPGSPGFAVAQRFAALPAAVRRGWLTQHLAALRAGRISLGQLP
ncbi:MAG TPA: hypothetical protein VGI05_26200 [Streptosporangiaceae bacterium]|jgi:hypothetical protein